MSEIRRERRVLGRYLLADAIAQGGMATIHLGRLLGPVGFARTVAIKCLHPQFSKDPEFVASFLDEARLAARIQHPNVAQTLDVVATDGELFVVMEYVVGESLSQLLKRLRNRDARMPPRIASSILTHALYGLHAAHEAKSDDGDPLSIVHRDVSPHNILVGIDGVARVADFGIAKAAKRSKETEVGRIKGKIPYMSPEQVKSQPLDRRSDVFSAGIVSWEVLTGRRLFEDTDPYLIMSKVLEAPIAPPSRFAPGVSAEADAVVLRALSRSKAERFPTAREMAIALEHALPPAFQREVGEWVEQVVGDELERRGQALERLEREESESGPVPGGAPAGEATADYQHSVVAEVPAPAEPATQVTTRMPAEPAPARKRHTSTAVLGAIAGALLFVLLLVVALSTRAPEAPVHVPLAATTRPEPSPSASAPVDLEEKPVSPADLPHAEIVAVDSGRPPVTPPKPRAPQPAPDCKPPYWVDGDGIKHYKKNCNLGN